MTYLSRIALVVLFSASVSASSILYNAGCSIFGGGNDFHQTSTPGLTMTASLPSVCNTSASNDYSTIRLYASTSAVGPASTVTGSAYTEMQMEFFLTDPSLPANTIIAPLSISVAYDFILDAGPGTSGGGTPGFNTGSIFDMRKPNEQSWLFRVSSGSDVFGGNSCPNPTPTYPQCNGHYVGIVNVPLTDATRVNSNGPGGIGPNVFRLAVSIQSGNTATTDASHTVYFGGTTLPAGTTVSYLDLNGNPLNLNAAAAPTGVPEPGTLLLLGAGLGGLLVNRGIRGKIGRS